MGKMKILTATALVALVALSGCRTTKEALQIGDAAEKNPGPCPRAFSLYDAQRIVEFKGTEKFANVGFTGEIGKMRSLCRYYGEQPIIADLEIDMEFGRGPQAEGDTATYEYFVAVTRKNVAVIHKEVFPVTVRFPEGQDRVSRTEKLDKITIPRAGENTSGVNFEIVVGFVVTDAQREFNAAGKRFRVSAGQN